MASINLTGKHYDYAIEDKYEQLETKLKNNIDKKFGYCRKLIGRAKWKKKFSSGRRLSDSFGRWNR